MILYQLHFQSRRHSHRFKNRLKLWILAGPGSTLNKVNEAFQEAFQDLLSGSLWTFSLCSCPFRGKPQSFACHITGSLTCKTAPSRSPQQAGRRHGPGGTGTLPAPVPTETFRTVKVYIGIQMWELFSHQTSIITASKQTFYNNLHVSCFVFIWHIT